MVGGQRHASATLPPKHPVAIVQEAGWAPGPVWTDAENHAPTGIRSPDRPARSESLYRLSYPGPLGDIPTLGLRCYGMLRSVDWWLPTLRENLSVPSSRTKQSARRAKTLFTTRLKPAFSHTSTALYVFVKRCLKGQIRVLYLLKCEVFGAKAVAVCQSEAEEPHPFMASTFRSTHYVMQCACSLAVIFILKPGLCFFPHAALKLLLQERHNPLSCVLTIRQNRQPTTLNRIQPLLLQLMAQTAVRRPNLR
jgi:hypothetical protein